MAPPRDHTLVDSPDGAAKLGAKLTAAPSHALDSEANSGFA